MSEKEEEKPARKYDKFVGAYLPTDLYEFLERRVERKYSNITQVLRDIVLKEMRAENKRIKEMKEKRL